MIWVLNIFIEYLIYMYKCLKTGHLVLPNIKNKQGEITSIGFSMTLYWMKKKQLFYSPLPLFNNLQSSLFNQILYFFYHLCMTTCVHIPVSLPSWSCTNEHTEIYSEAKSVKTFSNWQKSTFHLQVWALRLRSSSLLEAADLIIIVHRNQTAVRLSAADVVIYRSSCN